MGALFLHLLTLSLTCTAVLLPLLLCLPKLRSRYAGRTCYVLWLLLSLWLLVPIQISLPEPPVKVDAPSYQVPIRPFDNTSFVQVPIDPTEKAPMAQPLNPSVPVQPQQVVKSVSLTTLLGWVWLAGAVGRLLCAWVSYFLVRRSLTHWTRPVDRETAALLARLRSELNLRRSVELRRSYRVRSPMTIGLWKPLILLPGERLSSDPEDMEFVLLHELTHLKRYDVAYKALLVLCTAVHWFNPAVWLMSREAGRNLELCCDDAVIRHWDSARRRKYGEVLLCVAAADSTADFVRPTIFSTHFGGGKNQLKGRLTNLFGKKRNSKILVCAVLALAVLAGSLVACEQKQPLTAQQALDALEESFALTYQDNDPEAQFPALSFQLPKDYPGQWNLHISGQATGTELGGISLHYLEDETWTPGKSYALPLTLEQWMDTTELTMTAYLTDTDGTELDREIDLRYTISNILYNKSGTFSLQTVPSPNVLTHTNSVYGFSLTLPGSWADNWDEAASNEWSRESGMVFCWNLDGVRGRICALSVQQGVEADAPIGDNARLLGYRAKDKTMVVLKYSPQPEGLSEKGLALWRTLTEDLRALPDTSFSFTDSIDNESYTSSMHGFSLFLPSVWAGHYRVAEDENGVSCYLSPTPEKTGEALLFQISVVLDSTHGYTFTDRERFLGVRGSRMYLLTLPEDSMLNQPIMGPEEEQSTQDLYRTLYNTLTTPNGLQFHFNGYPGAERNVLETALNRITYQDLAQPQGFDPVTGVYGPVDTYTYTDSRLDDLEYAGTVGDFSVYSLEYRVLVDHPEAVTPVGGQSIDEDGWFRPYSLTCYLLFESGQPHSALSKTFYYSDLGPDSPQFWYELMQWQSGDKALTNNQWKTVAMAAYGIQDYSVLNPARCVTPPERAITKSADELMQGNYPQRYETMQEQVTFLPLEGFQSPLHLNLSPSSIPLDNSELLRGLYTIFSENLAKERFRQLIQVPDAPVHAFDGQLYLRKDTPLSTESDWDTFQLEEAGTVENDPNVAVRLSFLLDGAPYTLESGDNGHGYAWRFTRFAGEE